MVFWTYTSIHVRGTILLVMASPHLNWKELEDRLQHPNVYVAAFATSTAYRVLDL